MTRLRAWAARWGRVVGLLVLLTLGYAVSVLRTVGARVPWARRAGVRLGNVYLWLLVTGARVAHDLREWVRKR